MPHSKGWERRKDRRSDDAVPLGEIVDGLLAEDLFARGLPIARLVAEWPRLVGERLAAETAPMELSNGVLVVAASSGPWGAQVRFLHDEIRKKAAAELGETAVRQVRIVVRDLPENRR